MSRSRCRICIGMTRAAPREHSIIVILGRRRDRCMGGTLVPAVLVGACLTAVRPELPTVLHNLGWGAVLILAVAPGHPRDTPDPERPRTGFRVRVSFRSGLHSVLELRRGICGRCAVHRLRPAAGRYGVGARDSHADRRRVRRRSRLPVEHRFGALMARRNLREVIEAALVSRPSAAKSRRRMRGWTCSSGGSLMDDWTAYLEGERWPVAPGGAANAARNR